MKAFSFFSICFVFILLSCNMKVVPFQKEYNSSTYSISTTQSKDLTWSKVVNYLTITGVPILSIDKGSGVITSDKISFLNSYTWEDKSGNIMNSNALVVCNKVRGPFTIPVSEKPTSIYGQWIISVQDSNQGVVVQAKLANANGNLLIDNSDKNGSARQTFNLQIQSTGMFERQLESAIN